MFKSKAKKWCSKPFDIETQKAVSELFYSPKKLEEAFYKDIEFGTGGIRGLIGVGTNRINKYTLGRCAQGLSNYLNALLNSSYHLYILYILLLIHHNWPLEIDNY